MSFTHIHLLLNHFPVIGTIMVTVLFGVALARRSSELGKVSLALLAAFGAMSVLVYFTGEPAEEAIEKLPGFSESITERHEEFALIATIVLASLGAAALAALAVVRRRELPRLLTFSAFILSIGASGVMAYTAMLGGQVRHTEVRPGIVAVTDD
jgi:uncharacterized membrane protein